jgi:hypothetical protein
MALRHVPVLTADGEPMYTADGEPIVLAETEEYNPSQDIQWRLYRFDFKPREEDTA